MKEQTINAYSKDEAISKAGLTHVDDATVAYRNAKDKEDFNFDDWAEKQIMERDSDLVITIEPGVPNTKQRPYDIENVVSDGTRKYQTFYMLVDSTSNTLLKYVNGKSEAIEEAKKLYKQGFMGDVTCYLVKLVSEGEAVAFRAKFSPSKGYKLGTYKFISAD